MTGPVDQPRFYSQSQLKRISDAVEGRASSKNDETTQANINDDVQLGSSSDKEVLIMPKMDIMKSSSKPTSEQVASSVEAAGVEVGEKLDLVSGVVAKVDEKEAKKLEDMGYMIYDNSPKEMFPGIPSSTMQTDQAELFKKSGTGKSSQKGKAKVPKGGKPWDMPVVEDVKWTGAEKLHKQGFTGKGTVIAVIDSGLQPPEGTQLKGWFDAVDGYESPTDPNGHGTHVAGDTKKMAPDAELVGVRVMGDEGTGSISDIIKGIQWTIDNKDALGINVINMSLGSPPDGYPYPMNPMNIAVERAIESGITVVAAAGNSGPYSGTLGSPADVPETIAVGAARDKTTVSDFSSRGPTDDGFIKPDIMAPGEFIVSWAVPGSELDKAAKSIETLRHMEPEQLRDLFEAKPQLIDALGLPKDLLDRDDGEMEEMTKMHLPGIYKPTEDTLACPGTSFASPEVAGLVADLVQAKPDAKPGEIKVAMMTTTDDMGESYDANAQGTGFVRADKAKTALLRKSKKKAK